MEGDGEEELCRAVVSARVHPIEQRPFYALHACATAALMRALLAPATPATSATCMQHTETHTQSIRDPHSAPDHLRARTATASESDSRESDRPDGPAAPHYLISWLSLVAQLLPIQLDTLLLATSSR